MTTDPARRSFLFASGYSNGAGSCDGGKAAVGGYHLDDSNGSRQFVEKPLSEGQVGLSVNGEFVDPATPKTLKTQTDYTIRLETQLDPGFKGVLLRLEVPATDGDVDTTIALLPVNTTAMKVSGRCDLPIIGLTHTSSDDKKFVEGTLRLNQAAANVRLDVTMVAVNDERGSLYGYDYYLFNFEGDSAPAAAPVNSGPTTSSPTISVNLVNDIQGTLAPSRAKSSASSSSFVQTTRSTTMLFLTMATTASTTIFASIVLAVITL